MRILIQTKFLVFIRNLDKWLKDNKNIKYSQYWVILDNCTSHKTKIVTQYIRNTNWEAYFMPPYSPQFTPVEIAFAILKKEFIKICSNHKVNCKKNEIYFKLLSSLKRLTKNTWIDLYSKILARYINHIQYSFRHFW